MIVAKRNAFEKALRNKKRNDNAKNRFFRNPALNDGLNVKPEFSSIDCIIFPFLRCPKQSVQNILYNIQLNLAY